MPQRTSPRSGRPRRGRALVAAGMSLLIATISGVTAVPTASLAASAPDEPDTAALAGDLLNQTVSWQSCTEDFSKILFRTPGIRDKLLAVPGLACADITVPRDWRNPQDGNTITLRVSKTATSEGADRQGIALVNPGGPGGQGLPWGAAMALRAPELAKKYDFIGFDPRGVGESTPLACTVEIDDDGSNWLNDQAKTIAEGCRTLTPLAAYITTEQTAYDMDFIRVLMGQPKTSYLGYSYGTWLGAWYAATFPSKVHRMVLDSATDVSKPSLQETWDLQAISRDRAFQEQFLPYVARHDDLYQLGTDPIKIRETWESLGGTRSILGLFLSALLIIPAFYNTDDYPLAAETFADAIPLMRELLGASSANDPAAVTQAVHRLMDQQLARTDLTDYNRELLTTARDVASEWISKRTQAPTGAGRMEISPAISVFETIRCSDGQWNQNLAYWDSWQSDLERKAPFIAPFSAEYSTGKPLYPVCAYWPTGNEMPKPSALTFPKVLVLNNELDAATAYEGALNGVKHLPGAHLISVDNAGSHGVFPNGTTCVDDRVDAYFLRGEQPQEQYTACQGLPLPGEDQTYEVAGSLGNKGALKTKIVTDEMREVNQYIRHLPPMIDPITGFPI